MYMSNYNKKICKSLHYSGDNSKKFWKRVNSLPAIDQRVLYACGCLLQNMEHDVISWLETAEVEAKRKEVK